MIAIRTIWLLTVVNILSSTQANNYHLFTGLKLMAIVMIIIVGFTYFPNVQIQHPT
ncbi:MAG: hypothetical protein IPN46_19160 [Saprospiraceae bacterium]|nr:hypothetical protein [Saprospiraceae bacterium]